MRAHSVRNNNQILRGDRGDSYFCTIDRECWRRDLRANLLVKPAVRSVTLNLANKFSQCTFSVAEHWPI